MSATTFPTGGFTTSFLGSDSSERTLCGIGFDPAQAAKTEKALELVVLCEEKIEKIGRALGLKNENGGRIEILVVEASAARCLVLAKLVAKSEKLKKVWKRSFDWRRALESQLAGYLQTARVDVAAKVYPRFIERGDYVRD